MKERETILTKFSRNSLTASKTNALDLEYGPQWIVLVISSSILDPHIDIFFLKADNIDLKCLLIYGIYVLHNMYIF